MIKSLDRIGSIGALLSAAAAPCCFPIFATVAAATGLGVFGPHETIVLYAFQAFALLSLVGLFVAYRSHHRIGPLLLGALSVAAIAYTFYWSFQLVVIYGGLVGLLVATVWNYFVRRVHHAKQPQLLSVITCPHCGHQVEETMPTNACLFFYDCLACHTRLKPLAGRCCVFCSYGSVPCPPVQIGSVCCS